MIGGTFPGKFKWLRGYTGNAVTLPTHIHVKGLIDGHCAAILKYPGTDNCIYGIPSCGDNVLKINPMTQEVSTLGGPFNDDWQWHG